MVKLIVSDIDGTLIPYGASALDPGLFERIRRLREKGVLFCPASGRQYHSLRTLFAPVADEIGFLCENGAVVFGPGAEDRAPVLSKTAMPRSDALALSRAILGTPGCDVLISGQNTSYVCACSQELIDDLRGRLGNIVRVVDDPADVSEEIIKVSAFCPGGTDMPAKALAEPWGAPYHMAVAGPAWLDFTLADKGTGLRGLCGALGASLSEVMAFGDNWNDAPMLDLVGTAYIMAGADGALKARFPLHCENVLPVLDALLDSQIT